MQYIQDGMGLVTLKMALMRQHQSLMEDIFMSQSSPAASIDRIAMYELF